MAAPASTPSPLLLSALFALQVGTGNVIRVLRGHASSVTGVCFSPLDGRIVCSVGADCSARVWRVDNGLMLKNLGSYDATARHNSWVLCVRFSPDGKIIATAGADCSVRLWSVETARMVVKLEGFRGWVRALAWTNDGSRLAAACNDCDVYVYHASGTLAATLVGHEVPVCAVAWSPDGASLVSGECLWCVFAPPGSTCDFLQATPAAAFACGGPFGRPKQKRKKRSRLPGPQTLRSWLTTC